MNSIEVVADLVHAHGAARTDAHTIADYLADRIASVTLATAYSSSHSALSRDSFLRHDMQLSPRQIRAWLALLRGTRPVRRGNRTVGGKPGLVQAFRVDAITDTERRRFQRLAHTAATGRLRGPRPDTTIRATTA
jgi:hypothetical protein